MDVASWCYIQVGLDEWDCMDITSWGGLVRECFDRMGGGNGYSDKGREAEIFVKEVIIQHQHNIAGQKKNVSATDFFAKELDLKE